MFACRHTVSDCGSTPATPSNTAIAPSSTLSDLSTSIVKSTWPGLSKISKNRNESSKQEKMVFAHVSMILMRQSFQAHVVAAEVIVIPLSCSCSIQSMVAVPS